MDRKIQDKSKIIRKKYISIFTITGSIVFVLISIYLFSATGGKVKIQKDRIRIAEVKKAVFDDIISIQGSVEPAKSFFLDAVEGGTVEEIYVETGMMVKRGQPLLRLSNTQLMLDFMNRETQIVEQINNLRNTRMQMELNERNIKEQVLEIEYEKQMMERKFSIDTSLYAADVIAEQEFLDSYDQYKYLERKQKLLKNSYNKDERYRALQIGRIDSSIAMMERNLIAIRENLENLTVKAPISGQLTSFEAEVGESKAKGENLGRIDVLDHYIVKAQIDEHYLSRVRPGQIASYMEQGHEFILKVTKVLPEVKDNLFTIELAFTDSLPERVSRGQSLSLRLALSSSFEAVLVPRGSFYSSSGGKWVYVVTADGSEAIKRSVKMGRQNPDFIEVIEGLEPGEKIITSSYEIFSDYDVVIIE